jgi:hypothetical protein
MAIYRSDQTKVTFAAEAALGGTPEPIFGVAGSATNASDLDGAASPGDKKITVSAAAGVLATAGNFIIIGNNTTGSSEATQLAQQEIRRIEVVSGTDLYLDRPIGHYHPDAAIVKHVTAFPVDYSSSAGYFSQLTWIPGVYDTVTLPEPSNAVDPTYFLGFDNKRNYSHAYRGQQSFDGSISSFALLNGWPLRFVFGSVSSTGTVADASDLTTTIETAAKKGDLMIIVEEDDAEELETLVAVGDFISITAAAATTDAATGITTDAGTDIRQIVKREDTSGATGTFIMHLNMPLSRNYAAGDAVQELVHTTGTTVYTHTITEQNELPSISMQAMFKDTADNDANAFIRKYYGGYVSSASISAEEGGLVQMSWDSIPFMGMVHNIENAFGGGSQVTDIPGYTLTGTPGTNASYDYVGAPVVEGTAFGADASVVVPNTHASSSVASTYTSSYPQTDPYYFTQGEITLHGVVVARIRDFSISINNNVESRYYIEKRGDMRRRGPSQLHEGRREYTMSCTVVPDSIQVAKTGTSASRTIFEEYLMQGDYGAFGSNEGIKGIGLKIEFTRATNDTITLEVTGSSTQGAPNAYITNAPMQIDGNNPLQIPVEIGIRTWDTIQVKDKEPFYP